MGTRTAKDAREAPKGKTQKGVTTVEYAVMLVLIAIAVLAFGSGIANTVTGVFSNLTSALS
jgi:Flp pilus assembly pilin Flp